MITDSTNLGAPLCGDVYSPDLAIGVPAYYDWPTVSVDPDVHTEV